MRQAWALVLALVLVPGAWGGERRDALQASAVWAPALVALGLAATPADDGLSRWARRETPLFGGTAGARRASDVLLGAGLGLALASTWLVPKEARAWDRRLGALVATGAGVFALKRLTGRPRPDGSDDLSFPSGHAALAFAAATLTQHALARSHLAPGPRRALGLAAWGMAAATAWARVEAGAHYPSDVLAGAALGGLTVRFTLAGGEAGLSWGGDVGPRWHFRHLWR